MFVFKVLPSPSSSIACSCRLGLHPDCGGRPYRHPTPFPGRIISPPPGFSDCGGRMLVDLLVARAATKAIDILLARAAPKVLKVLRARVSCGSHWPEYAQLYIYDTEHEYPLLFPYGEDGYHEDLKYLDTPQTQARQRCKLTLQEYCTYRLHDRPGDFNTPLRDLFVTFTSNAAWTEISEVLSCMRGQQPSDCSDIVNRVFKMKLNMLMDDIKKKQFFGPINAVIYTVEFQKRGLPNAHIIICSGQVNNPMADMYLSSYTLNELDKLLRDAGYCLSHFNLPVPDDLGSISTQNRLLLDEISYDVPIMTTTSNDNMSRLNNNQKDVFDAIYDSVIGDRGRTFFVYGYGGTGKTFFWTTLLNSVRSQGKIALAIASSGIASLLNLDGLISFVYNSDSEPANIASYFCDRAILAPTNEMVSKINSTMTAQLAGTEITYYSSDSIDDATANHSTLEALYPTEFLNTISMPGLPDHKLNVKIGVPIMLLRNLDPSRGLCNAFSRVTSPTGLRVLIENSPPSYDNCTQNIGNTLAMVSASPLKSITLGQQSCKVIGRLLRLWDAINMKSRFPDPLISIDGVLLDEDGTVVQISVPKKFQKQFRPLLAKGNVYMFTDVAAIDIKNKSHIYHH
ncbi:hypothetical protein U9M48_039027 [Paspalum notatum var. saurae]|uniref:ATP-dependent DNA helicase n=1 Tax=Paspalum notatum var. saurae TaxID=547442 RepID=A0AAQ3UJT9_PASNO